ncbi:MAG: DUF2062 domain-containing protein [Lentisphaeria bacterium]|jgi:hypothetical protein
MKRTIRYYFYRVVRARGEPEDVARAVALGVFVGLVVPPPFQILVALALAFPVRANRPVAVLATFVNNPLTMPVFYPFACFLGMTILGRTDEPATWAHLQGLGRDVSALSRDLFTTDLTLVSYLQHLWAELGPMFWGFLLGSLLIGLATAVPAYALTLWGVRRFRAHRAKRLAAKAAGRHRLADWLHRHHPPPPPPPE